MHGVGLSMPLAQLLQHAHDTFASQAEAISMARTSRAQSSMTLKVR
jgi:hypothetical protein